MTEPKFDISESEREAMRILLPELDAHMSLSLRSFNLVGRVGASPPPAPLEQVPLSRRVSSVLMAHLSNHLRCSAMVAIRGYPAQSCALAASVYEAAFGVMAIASDDVRARKWVDHNDPNSLVFPVKKLTRDGLLNVTTLQGRTGPTEDEIEQLTERRYTVYRQLCWPKHLNPIFVRIHSVSVEAGRVWVNNGPDSSEDAVRALWFGLEHACGLAASACAVFIEHHVPKENRAPLTAEVNETISAAIHLNRLAAERWGTENPFPEKWRFFAGGT